MASGLWRRRRGAVEALAALVLLFTTAVWAPQVAAQSTPSPSPSPSAGPSAGPSPGASPSPSTHAEQDQFRAYVSMVTIDGAGLVAALADLRSCNEGRQACRQALNAASDRVNTFQADLDQTSPPACLAGTDAELRASLGFFESGLALVEEGADAKDRLKVTQGALLLGVGAWKLGVAIRTARRSECDRSP